MSRAIFDAPITLPWASNSGETVRAHVHIASVLAPPDRFIGLDRPPARNLLENAALFILSIRWNEQGHGPADHFVCSISKQSFRRSVPSGHDAL